jgi:hypothetical protein
MKPKRIQLSRRKGYRKPEGAVVVSRPSKWGNPFRTEQDEAGRWWVVDCSTGAKLYRKQNDAAARQSAVNLFRAYLANDGSQYGAIRDDGGAMIAIAARDELRGKDLGCWCPLGRACHADVLLEIANAEGGGK